ncbi:YbiU family protein [Litorivicinus lipolyticus]|uniref:YbiU family protein n=1 Tax=Litorivicinus lipolyticus TaxID=418701 RepID=UPI003B5BDAC9
MAFDFDQLRRDIRATKCQLRADIPDLAERFAKVDADIRHQIAEINGADHPIPELSAQQVMSGQVSDPMRALIKRRGCVVIRGVFDRDRVERWNQQLLSYVHDNDYFTKQRAKAGLDNYFGELGSSKPQIFGLYWSKPQMEARQSPELAQVRRWLNRLWQFEHEGVREFDPDQECLYPDRVRQREPGDKTLGLSPHIDGGSVERWLDSTYRDVYRHVFSGDVDQYDPFDARFRSQTHEIPSPAVCSMFRTFQGWTALTTQGAGNGTLNLVPIANVMAWILLRTLLDDTDDDDLCGAAPGRAMPIKDAFHALLLEAYVPIPTVNPGDTVWWHPDVIHGVEDHNQGPGYSNVFYIGAAPDCAKNRAFLDRLRPKFEAGESSPDFAAEDYEVDFADRFQIGDLTELGRRQLGYDR